ncbi:hypothetical protein B0H63DRAFT_8037 [Podospora didyma]|uniref:Uncharacterized protein n=1 Tax=Podospora didyma TaxID=330526 RepID=A0AAE0P4D9_9PEZI|nr:hypothetical protein B0H63DRAFT_8037 [Podospora didyma]
MSWTFILFTVPVRARLLTNVSGIWEFCNPPLLSTSSKGSSPLLRIQEVCLVPANSQSAGRVLIPPPSPPAPGSAYASLCFALFFIF